MSGVSNVNEYAIKKYSDTWEQTFIASKENDDYWSTMRQYGRMKKSNLEVFLHAYAVIKSFFDPSVDYMTELPRKYKDYISGKSLDELDKFLEETCDYAIIFKDCFSENENLSYSDYVGRIFNICNALELSTFYPYLLQQLYLLKKKLADEEVIKNRLFGLEKYIILNAICNGTTKNYNKECIQLVNGSIDSQSLINGSSDINDGRFMNGLRNMTSNKLPTLLLFWVELYLRQSDYFGVRNLNYEFTLEHIMPQKWKENWLDVPAYNINGDLCETIEEKEYTRRKSIYEIGNMTLLKSKLNSSVSNGTFEDKKNGKNGKPGIIYYGDLLITNEVTKEDEWNDKKIYQRTQLMEDRIREIWDAQDLPEESEAKTNPEGGRHKVRYEFWKYALPIIRNINDNQIYTNHIAKTSNCVAGSIGIGGFSVNITANFDKARVDFSLYKKDANENKKAFDILYSKKAEIEEKIGRSLIWSRCEELRGSWVSYEMSNVSIANKEDWDKMANFLGEGSKKFRETFISDLEKDYPVETSNIDPDIQLKRIASYEIIKDWIQQTDKIVPCLEKSNRRYIRFTTKKMSEYLPNIAGSRSGWNSENHYFYEIINKNGSNIYVKFVISGFDLNEELKAKVTKIIDVADEKLNREEWKWWTVYSTDKYKLPDNLNKDKSFEVLDNLIEYILEKEKSMLDVL